MYLMTWIVIGGQVKLNFKMLNDLMLDNFSRLFNNLLFKMYPYALFHTMGIYLLRTNSDYFL